MTRGTLAGSARSPPPPPLASLASAPSLPGRPAVCAGANDITIAKKQAPIEEEFSFMGKRGVSTAAPCRLFHGTINPPAETNSFLAKMTLLVNVLPVADSHHQHQQFAILDLAENPLIPNAITPQPGEIGLQSLAETAWIGLTRNPLIEVGQYLELQPVSGS